MPKQPKQRQTATTTRSVHDWWARAGVVVAILGLLLQWHASTAEQARQRKEVARQLEEQGRRLEVTLLFDVMFAPGGVQLPKALVIRAKNPPPQTHDMWVNQAGVVFPNGSMLLAPKAPGDWQFPCLVRPGQSRSYLFSRQALQSICDFARSNGYGDTVDMVGFYVDGDDRVHKSKPLQFNIEEGLKLARSQIERAGSVSAAGTPKSQ